MASMARPARYLGILGSLVSPESLKFVCTDVAVPCSHACPACRAPQNTASQTQELQHLQKSEWFTCAILLSLVVLHRTLLPKLRSCSISERADGSLVRYWCPFRAHKYAAYLRSEDGERHHALAFGIWGSFDAHTYLNLKSFYQ
jgi:hypothetical protein